MEALPASQTAGDRAKVKTADKDESNGDDARPLKRDYVGGPSSEGDPGWSDGFKVGGSDVLR